MRKICAQVLFCRASFRCSHHIDRCVFCLQPHGPLPDAVTCWRRRPYWRPLPPEHGTYYTVPLLFSSSVLNHNEIAFKPFPPAPLEYNSAVLCEPLLEAPSTAGHKSVAVNGALRQKTMIRSVRIYVVPITAPWSRMLLETLSHPASQEISRILRKQMRCSQDPSSTEKV